MVSSQNVTHGDLVDVIAQVRESPLDTAIPPGGILFRHAHDQLLNLLGDTGAATRTTVLTPVKFLSDQSLVPA